MWRSKFLSCVWSLKKRLKKRVREMVSRRKRRRRRGWGSWLIKLLDLLLLLKALPRDGIAEPCFITPCSSYIISMCNSTMFHSFSSFSLMKGSNLIVVFGFVVSLLLVCNLQLCIHKIACLLVRSTRCIFRKRGWLYFNK